MTEKVTADKLKLTETGNSVKRQNGGNMIVPFPPQPFFKEDFFVDSAKYDV